ncbi:TIGR03618 family F420-dependent PPOX class oxidoreductase [Streptomyces sp. H27-D2]|uniref:TIGR03618 family F420-dependent PPOX class oxidoreductase n=1 Tax=Streptomyces sp. H27-D2 TaxID=3046304 RepID=UPI002DBF9651|nr:TIGR03618 family F420-dependent PPOX class oxidoreductase [Streptomyces sp. H27-D2]MEC4020322.1 TIGR03618 family F420-dependent PPOX class oxidoreductase [Streptomyces sp. H27-D2]
MAEENSGQGAGPAPRVLSDGALSELLSAQQFGILATNKRSGHPHLTTMLYAWDPATRTVRFSTTADRVKVRQLHNDPRAALHVSSEDHWSFAVAEGEAEVSDVTGKPGDATGRELFAMLPLNARPSAPEERDAFFGQLVAEQRVVIRLAVNRLYGTALDVPGAD